MKLTNKKILLIEDDTLVGEMYKNCFAAAGAKITWASDGKIGLEILKNETFDLIITDLMMPKMDGYELVQHLKKNKDTKDIPVIILTNLTDRPEDAEKIKKLGVVEYIIKSDIRLKDLVKKISALLHKTDEKKIKVKSA